MFWWQCNLLPSVSLKKNSKMNTCYKNSSSRNILCHFGVKDKGLAPNTCLPTHRLFALEEVDISSRCVDGVMRDPKVESLAKERKRKRNVSGPQIGINCSLDCWNLIILDNGSEVLVDMFWWVLYHEFLLLFRLTTMTIILVSLTIWNYTMLYLFTVHLIFYWQMSNYLFRHCRASTQLHDKFWATLSV